MKHLLHLTGLTLIFMSCCADKSPSETNAAAKNDTGVRASNVMKMIDWPVEEKEVGPSEFSDEYLKPYKSIDEHSRGDRIFLGCDQDYFYIAVFPPFDVPNPSVLLFKTKRLNFPDGFPTQDLRKELERAIERLQDLRMKQQGPPPQPAPQRKLRNKELEKVIVERGIQGEGATAHFYYAISKMIDWPVEEKEIGAAEFSNEYLKGFEVGECMRAVRMFLQSDRDKDYYYIAVFLLVDVGLKPSVLLFKTKCLNFPDGFPTKEVIEEQDRLLATRMTSFPERPEVRNNKLDEIIAERGIQGELVK